MALYRTCKRMIERGQTAGMEKKLDIFYAAAKLTDEQYAELTEMLNERPAPDRAVKGRDPYGNQTVQPENGRRKAALPRVPCGVPLPRRHRHHPH